MHASNTIKPWGHHLVLDLSGCPNNLISSKENIVTWVKELVEKIGMKAHGEPLLEHFATHSHDAAGYTMLQLIETSNISAHFAENIGQVYIDIFSCKEFDAEIAVDVCSQYFSPKQINKTPLVRGSWKNSDITHDQFEAGYDAA